MADNVHQDPDDMRVRRDRDHRVVPGLQDRAKDDPDWERRLYEGGGYGIHAYAMMAREKRLARTAGWTRTADGYQGSGDTWGSGATTFENNDQNGANGASGVST